MRSFFRWNCLLSAAMALALMTSGVSAQNAARAPVKDFQLTKALVGAVDGPLNGYLDVTDVLKRNVADGGLSMVINQPFQEFGGDPASGHVKSLIVEYRAGGKLYRVTMREGNPAFDIELPSADAVTSAGALPAGSTVPPANDNSHTILIGEVKAEPPASNLLLVNLALGVSFIALLCAVAALIQVRKLKRGGTP